MSLLTFWFRFHFLWCWSILILILILLVLLFLSWITISTYIISTWSTMPNSFLGNTNITLSTFITIKVSLVNTTIFQLKFMSFLTCHSFLFFCLLKSKILIHIHTTELTECLVHSFIHITHHITHSTHTTHVQML